MASETDDIKIPQGLALTLPQQGNVVPANQAELDKAKSDATQAALQKTKDEEAQSKGVIKGNQAGKGNAGREITQDEINSKLEELSKKEDKDLSKEDKAFIEQYNVETEEEIQANIEALSKKDEKDLTEEEKIYIQNYKDSQDDEITSTKKDIENEFGIELEGKYENNPTGLKQLAKDVAPVLAQQMHLNYLDNIPYMRAFFDHVAIEGKSIETFLLKNIKPEFEGIKITSLNDLNDVDKVTMTSNLKSLMIMNLKAKGNSEDDIRNLVDLAEANNTLYDKAKNAKEELTKNHKAQVEAKIQLEEQAKAKAKVDAKAQFDEINKMISKNNIEGLSLPDTDIKPFKDFLFKPIDREGNTLADIKRNKISLGQETLIDYLLFKEFKVNGLKTSTSKDFSFSSLKKENDLRKGGRLTNISEEKEGKKGINPKIQMGEVDFRNLMKATG